MVFCDSKMVMSYDKKDFIKIWYELISILLFDYLIFNV